MRAIGAVLLACTAVADDMAGQRAAVQEGAALLLHVSNVNAVDTDHDGFLDGDELVAFAAARRARTQLELREAHFLKLNGGEGSGTTGSLRTAMEQLDGDGDGYVSKGELQAAQALTAPTEKVGGSATHGVAGGATDSERARLHAAFSMADEDGDGRLGAREYHLLLHPEFIAPSTLRQGEAPSAAEAAWREGAATGVMQVADADGDEALSFAEYWNHVAATAAAGGGAGAGGSGVGGGVAAMEDAHFELFGRHAVRGLLSHDGLVALQAEHAAAPPQQSAGQRAARALLLELDSDEDGRLSPKELFTDAEKAKFAKFVRTLDAAERATVSRGIAPQGDPLVHAALSHDEL